MEKCELSLLHWFLFSCAIIVQDIFLLELAHFVLLRGHNELDCRCALYLSNLARSQRARWAYDGHGRVGKILLPSSEDSSPVPCPSTPPLLAASSRPPTAAVKSIIVGHWGLAGGTTEGFLVTFCHSGVRRAQ